MKTEELQYTDRGLLRGDRITYRLLLPSGGKIPLSVL